MNIRDQIEEKYPQLVDEYISLNCGKGWHPIVLEVCERIKFKLNQKKE